jgi:hypothetical protein
MAIHTPEPGAMRLYRVVAPYMVVGVIVTAKPPHLTYRAAPMLSWMYGKSIHVLEQWCVNKGFECERVT